MLLRLQNYTYAFVHVPGKDLHLADTLSRACTEDPPIEEADPLEHILNSVVVTDLTDAELTELQSATARDLQYSQLTDVVMAGWPENKKNCPSILTPFWDYRDEITVCQQVLLKGQSLMIPAPLRHKYTIKAHNAHLRTESSIRRAKQSIFWPSKSADIRAAVQKCEICARAAPNQQKQPLQQPEIPTTAWHTVSADIFTLDRKDYLVTVDSLSGFFEVDGLRTLTTAETILKLRMIFARFGCPRRLVTDNARHFTSKEFATFATNWRFEHKTSSPHYARSNGMAESAVKSAKNILKKAKESNTDVYQALLDHRNTPRMATGLSPAQVLYQHPIRTATLPHHSPPTAQEQQAFANTKRGAKNR